MNPRTILFLVGFVACLSWTAPLQAAEHGYLGVYLAPVPEGEAPGAIVQEIILDSPADRDGLRAGDKVISANDTTIDSAEQLIETTQALQSGSQLKLTLVRGSATEQLTITLGDVPDRPLRDLPLKPRPSLGVALVAGEAPPRIAHVLPGSAAEQAGLQANDVIVVFDGRALANYQELIAMVAARKPGDTVNVKLKRNGEELEKPVTLGNVSR